MKTKFNTLKKTYQKEKYDKQTPNRVRIIKLIIKSHVLNCSRSNISLDYIRTLKTHFKTQNDGRPDYK